MATTEVPAPMTGSVLELLVAPGDRVQAGQEILVIESMKMEIPVESPASGAVDELLVAQGDSIEEGQLLLRLATD